MITNTIVQLMPYQHHHHDERHDVAMGYHKRSWLAPQRWQRTLSTMIAIIWIMCITIIIPLSSASLSSSITSWFRSSDWSHSQLQVVDIGLPIPSYNATLAAFGDVNGDKSTDLLFIMNINGTYRVQCYIWNRGSYSYNMATSSGAMLYISELLPITAVHTGDFNFDGKLDLLIVGPNSTVTDAYVRLHLYIGTGNGAFAALPIVLPPSNDEPLVCDIDSDLKLDLLGGSGSDGKRTIWYNNGPTGQSVISFTVKPQVVPSLSLPYFSSPHSNAYVDLDGDCLPDLFVITQSISSSLPSTDDTPRQFELWRNDKSNGWKFQHHWDARPGTGQVTFMDFDGDGSMDILFGVCWPRHTCTIENTIHIYYNVQQSMCGTTMADRNTGVSGCRSSTSLCSSDPYFRFDNLTSEIVTRTSHAHVIVDLNAVRDIRLLDDGVHPITIRAGDINLDGYPDLLVALYDNHTCTNHMSLWLSVPCDSSHCNDGATYMRRRTFVRSTDGVKDLEAISGAFAATFYDINDRGQLDIMVLSITADGHYITTAVRNNFEEDAYFLTTLVSNGVCPAWCPTDYWPAKFPDPKPYGVNNPGTSVKFTLTDLSGDKTPRQGVHMPQSAYLSLHTPYMVHGLGRTNNFIEEFYVGVALNQPQHWQMWVAQIPNSQLVCFPYEWTKPETWILELFISPSTRLLIVAISLISSLVGIAGIILFFHIREKREDDHERLLATIAHSNSS